MQLLDTVGFHKNENGTASPGLRNKILKYWGSTIDPNGLEIKIQVSKEVLGVNGL